MRRKARLSAMLMMQKGPSRASSMDRQPPKPCSASSGQVVEMRSGFFPRRLEPVLDGGEGDEDDARAVRITTSQTGGPLSRPLPRDGLDLFQLFGGAPGEW